MADEPITGVEARQLRDSIRELTGEFRAFRQETAQTFVRQDNHQRDLRILQDSSQANQLLLTQTITALKESLDRRVEEVETRVDKIDSDSDWLKKIIYSTIVLGVLGLLSLSGAAAGGILK